MKIFPLVKTSEEPDTKYQYDKIDDVPDSIIEDLVLTFLGSYGATGEDELKEIASSPIVQTFFVLAKEFNWTPQQIKQMYEELLQGVPPDHLVVHCGSGVTACQTLLALDRAGLHGASLYVGSWGDWCRSRL